MEGIILAAGRSQRMGKISEKLPKVLLCIAGASLIEYQICLLERMGIRRITIVIGHHHRKVIDVVEKLHPAAEIAFFHSEKLLGCGHAVLCCRDLIKEDVLILNGDNFFSYCPSYFKESYSSTPIFLLLEGCRRGGIDGAFTIDEIGHVSPAYNTCREKKPYYIPVGCYILRRDMIQELAEAFDLNDEVIDFTDVLGVLISKGVKFQGMKMRGWRRNINTLTDLLFTNQKVLRTINSIPCLKVDTGISLEHSCRFGRSNDIVGPVWIARDAEVANSHIGPFVSIGKGSKIFDCQLSHSIVQPESTLFHKYASCSLLYDNTVIKLNNA